MIQNSEFSQNLTLTIIEGYFSNTKYLSLKLMLELCRFQNPEPQFLFFT